MDGKELLLGKRTPLVDAYAPQLLYPLPRAPGRLQLGLQDPLPFSGADLWHAYELSWLDDSGKPVARVGRLTIPASSPNMVESKSLKLYLNSLNNTRFSGDASAIATIVADVGAAAGEPVVLELHEVGDASLAGVHLAGKCLDTLSVPAPDAAPAGELLAAGTGTVEESVYSHLLRSLCPVTGQPDWATLWLHYRGPGIEHRSLLRYILAYRQHREFHEQCVERMFRDILRHCGVEILHIQAFYTRRGGLDINPLRSTDPAAVPLSRLNRQ